MNAASADRGESQDGGAALAAWRVEIAVPSVAHLSAFEAALAGLGGAVTMRGIGDGPGWRLIAHCVKRPDIPDLSSRLAVAAAVAGIAPPEAVVERLPPTDWVAEYHRNIAPQRVARFFIHPSHYHGGVPDGTIGIELDAGLAFGTGEHESTRGCLVALDGLAETQRVACALDLGCGSGILAVAIARLWGTRVLACDNDPVAVALAAGNAGANGVGQLIEAVESEGYAAPAVAEAAPYDLIVANILARPLVVMAADLARHLAPDGRAVLSGFLAGQAADISAAHSAHGLNVVDSVGIGEWSTLVLAGELRAE